MKKLTKRYDDGSYGVADDLPFGENSHDFKNALILRLGRYEHSPLIPTAWFPGIPPKEFEWVLLKTEILDNPEIDCMPHFALWVDGEWIDIYTGTIGNDGKTKVIGWQPIPDEKCLTEKKYDMSTREGFIEFMIDHNLTLNHLEDLWGRWVAFNYMSRDYIKKQLGGESDVL